MPFEEHSWLVRLDDKNNPYEGMLAVVDVLASIHGIELEEREEAKLMFVK